MCPAITKLTLEYDGRPFAGWAAQPGQRSIEEELERALGVVLRQQVRLTVAGRTDRGVHALGQVVSYQGPPPKLTSVNALLPKEISVRSAEVMPNDFSARHSAKSRSYMYRVHLDPVRCTFETGRSYWWAYWLDVDALKACAQLLDGQLHDFRAFTPTDTYHQIFERKILRADWRFSKEGPFRGSEGEMRRSTPSGILEFHIESRSFMRKMNRVLVGTMLEVANGKRTLDSFRELLGGRPRKEAGKTAPAHGLYLTGVKY